MYGLRCVFTIHCSVHTSIGLYTSASGLGLTREEQLFLVKGGCCLEKEILFFLWRSESASELKPLRISEPLGHLLLSVNLAPYAG